MTYAILEACDVVSFEDTISEDMHLTPAASAEAKSEHPLGKAIVAFAKNKQIKLTESTEFMMTAGKGVLAVIHVKNILCGNEKYLI